MNSDMPEDTNATLDEACPLLQVRGLGKAFDVNGAPVEVLRDVTFSVAPRQMVCVFGRSGCGKTTLLNVLAGFMSATSGSITMDGEPIRRPGPDRCVVFQEDALFPWLTARENIAFGPWHLGWPREKRNSEVERYLGLVGLSRYGDYLPRDISGGMKQRVALARVLILEPRVLLMDEPFASLDAQTRVEMQDLLISLWRQLHQSVVFVTHDADEAVKLADRIIAMAPGPGPLRDEVPVSLPRPRDATTTAYQDVKRRIRAALGGD